MGMVGGMGMHSMGMVSASNVGARSFAAIPMSRAAFAPSFSHPEHHAFFHHHFFHNRFNRFAYGGGPYFYAGYDDCWRRVWTAYGPQWVNICGYDNYAY
jgi:hypothetical protein